MNISQFRLIVSDLDGTLVKSGSDAVSYTVSQTIGDLMSRGIHFTIATGRSWKATQPIARALNVKAPIIVDSGAVIIDPVSEHILQLRGLEPELADNIDEISRPLKVDCFRLSTSGSFFCNEATTFYGKRLMSKLECELYRGKAAEHEISRSYIKFLLVGPYHLLQNLVAELTRRLSPAPYIVLWPPEPNGESFLEVFDPGVSKGNALKWLGNHLHIPLSQVIAFGDGDNDQDMLRLAGLGVTMRGASAELNAIADLIIPGPHEDGIACFLNAELRKAI